MGVTAELCASVSSGYRTPGKLLLISVSCIQGTYACSQRIAPSSFTFGRASSTSRVVMLLFRHVLLLTVVLLLLHTTDAANILFYLIFSTKSHMGAITPLIHELAAKGHTVTVLATFKLDKPPPPGIEFLVNDGLEQNMGRQLSDFDVFGNRTAKAHIVQLRLPIFAEESCRLFTTNPEMRQFITDVRDGRPKRTYDLIAIDPLANECALGLVALSQRHKKNVQFMYVVTNGLQPWLTAAMGAPSTLVYAPTMFVSTIVSHHESVWIRLQHLFGQLKFRIQMDWFVIPRMESMYSPWFFPDPVPSFRDIERNLSLTLLNAHPSNEPAMPYMPNVIEVGGIHILPVKPLPKHLDDFVEGSGDDGFVLFSLGSLANSKNMPKRVLDEILAAIPKMKQRILWKFEDESLNERAGISNLKVSKWLPQNDLLGHPKCRAFITHGGKLSTIEAVHHGLPIVVIPFFADQDMHAQIATEHGYGLGIEFRDLNRHNFLEALKTVVENPKYRENALRNSALLKDQLVTPLSKAVYWTEFIMRHSGAPQLRSPVRYYTWWQYYMIDVLGLLLLIITAPIIFLWLVWRFLYSHRLSESKHKED